MAKPVRKLKIVEKAKASNGPTWEDSERAAEFYWRGLGGQVVRQMAEWNRDLFEGKVPPAPFVLSRMSSIHNHHFPTLDPGCDPRRGFEATGVFQGRFGYQPPKPVNRVRRGDLMRFMMREYLKATGQNPSRGKPDWCRLVMRLHDKLKGERIWASEAREIYKDEIDATAPRSLTRRVRVVEQESDPKTGAASLSADRVKNWPLSVIDMPDIVREDA